MKPALIFLLTIAAAAGFAQDSATVLANSTGQRDH